MSEFGSVAMTVATSLACVILVGEIGIRRGWSIRASCVYYCAIAVPTLIAVHLLVGG